MYKIPIYGGVNDNPLAPNEVNNGNSDYFISKYNSLVDLVTKNGEQDTLTIFVDSTNGDDNNNGFSSANAFKTIKAGVNYINSLSINSQLNIGLIGVFSSLDLRDLNQSRDIYITPHLSDLVINGNIHLPPKGRVIFSNNSPYSISINSLNSETVKLYLNNSICVLDSTNLFATDTTGIVEKFAIYDGSLVFSGNINLENVNSSANESIIFKSINSNVLIDTDSFTINSDKIFKLIDFDILSGLIYNISGLPTFSNISVTELFNHNGNKLILPNSLNNSDELVIKSGATNIRLEAGDEEKLSKIIRDSLANLAGEDRLDISAIKNVNELTPVEVRDKLNSLSADDRLDASAIKNINYLSYYSTITSGFIQPAINNNATIYIGDSTFLTSGNYILIEGGGTYEVITVVDSSTIIIKNLGYGGNVDPGQNIVSGKKITLSGKGGENIYTFSLDNFIFPEINQNVDIMVKSIEIFAIGTYFYVDNTDYFEVISINLNNNIITSKRLGVKTNISVGSTINTNTKLIISGIVGPKGLSVNTLSTADFTQPAIYGTVSVSVISTEQYLSNNVVYVEGGGFYKVVSVDDAETLTLRNLGYEENASESTVINSGSVLIITGERGVSAFSLTTADFTTPTYNSNVSIDIQSTEWINVGSILKILDGYYEVISIDSISQITAKFLDYSITAETTLIPSLSKVISTGMRGAKGDQGFNSFTNFLQFTTPQVGSTVVLTVDTSEIFLLNGQVFIEGAGIYEVISIPDGTSITIKNLGLEGNEDPNIIIPAGKVSNTGKSFNGYTSKFSGTFTMPSLGATTIISSVENPYWLNIGDYLYLPTIGYLVVTSITGNDITVRNDYLSYNSIPTTTYSDGSYYLSLGNSFLDNIVLKTSADFVQPIIGTTVNVVGYTTKWLNPGMIISGLDSGHYEVISIVDDTNVTLKNLGYNYDNEVSSGTTILSGTEFMVVGGRGETAFVSTYSYLSNDFTQPATDSTVSINVNDSSWMTVGQGLSIEGGGPNYSITAINSATNITIKNLGYENVSSGSTILGSGIQVISPAGLRGRNSSTYINVVSGFNQPAVNSDIQISVDRSDVIQANSILSGPNSGYYRVVSIDSPTTITIKNLGYPTLNTVPQSTTINSGEILTIAGELGPTGYNATYSLLQANFTQPAIDSNVLITLNDTSWISPNQFLYVEGGGNYKVISVDSGTTLTLQNLGYENVAAGNTIVGSGTQKISPSGKRGLDGSVSSATFLSLSHQLSNPSPTLSSVNIFSKSDNNIYSVDPSGTEHKLNQDINIGNSLSNVLSITDNSGTNGLNLGDSNSIFGLNSILKIGPDGVNPSQITLFDEIGVNSVNIKSPNNSNLTTYTFVLPPNPGSNGEVLTTDGNGNTVWNPIVNGSLSSVTDGTTTVNDVTSINFASGATVAQDGTIANVSISGGGSGLTAVYTNDVTYTATADTLILVGPLTTDINLPSSPTDGTKITVCDYTGRFDTTSVSINSSGGNTIITTDTSLILNTKYSTVQLVYWTNKWVLYGTETFFNSSSVITVPIPPTNSLTTELVSANFNAVADYYYLVNTTSGEVSGLLPTDPPNGTKIAFVDYLGTFNTNNFIINAGGTNTISGNASITLSINGSMTELVYYDGIWTSLTQSNSSGGPTSISDIWLYGGF